MRGVHWLPGSVLSAFTPAVVPAMASVMRRAASAHYRRRCGQEQRDGAHLAPTGARRGAHATVCRNLGGRRSMSGIAEFASVAPSGGLRGRLVVLVAVALLVAGSSAQAKKKKVLPPLCSDNRYAVSGAPLVIGDAAPIQFVGIADNSLTLAACAGRLKLKATKIGTKLTGRVGTCPGVSGPLKVTGMIDPTCGSMAATVKGKKRLHVTFSAALSSCGDGVVDPVKGEACEPPGTATCDGQCQPLASPPTTNTTTSSTTTTTVPGSGVVITTDAARAATKTFPPGGGTLTATGADGTVYSLTIPSGALLVETAITMTPIVAISGGDLPSASLLGVDLQPSGLRLYEFADLSITPPQLGPTADIAGFTYEGDGDDLHRYPATLDAGRILLNVIHFSGAGANICVELCPPPIVPPQPPVTESQLEQLIASLDPHDPFYATRLAELLHGYYTYFIAPDLARMQHDCEFAGGRIPKVLAWSRTNQILLNEEGFEAENQTIGNALVGSVSNCWTEATQACLNPSNAYQVQNLLQIARQVQLLGGDPAAFDMSKLRRCSGLWSGTVTFERKYEEDGDVVKADSHAVFHHHRLTSSTWEIKPNVLAEVTCENCESRMYEATWRASVSVDLSYDLEYGNCRDTSSAQGQFAVTAPSAILISVAGDRQSFSSNRPSPGSMGAPPVGQLSHEFEGTRVYCSGDERTFPVPVIVTESLAGWPFSSGAGLPLERTDPTIPWTSAGQHVTRSEVPQADGSQVVITDTWSWKLTLEPDAGQ
jgi:hypothetical protein